MSTMAGEWYVSRGGERFGPVSFQDLIDAAKAGRLEPRTDLIYGSGLPTWTPAGDVDGVFERQAREAAAPPQAGHQPPANTLADSGSYDCGPQPTKLNLPGATRLGYFLGVTVLPALLGVGLSIMVPELIGMVPKDYGQVVPYLPFLPAAAIVFVLMVITVKRFQNLAMSGWWLLGLMVPILQVWLNYRLFACPPGYAYTKKLDAIGKVLATLYWLAVVASVVLPVLAFLGMLGQVMSSDEFRQWLEQAKAQMPEVPAAKP